MKTIKAVSLVICTAAVILIASCGKNESASERIINDKTGVESVLEQGMAMTDNPAEPEDVREPESFDKEPEAMAEEQNGAASYSINSDNTAVEEHAVDLMRGTEGIDVDLTALSSTMVYSEVYNMMYYPENYIGKTVKMKGLNTIYHDESTDKYYYACIISDATACCSQGIEYELTDNYIFPEDYPSENQEICVTGIFDTYQEGEYTYCTLRNAQLETDRGIYSQRQ
ncbi:MAG: hypothetical protein K5770_04445 [Lachnospiraceae bacterium]|nr:hypothetical protein [Lachnospiraceae bacterium]